MRSPFVYLPHERLSPAELSAARLDGDLVELGEGYIPADAIETASLRAATLRGLLGDRLAACLWSAAWIYGASANPPARHHLIRVGERRVTTVIDRRAHFHDVPLQPDEVVEIGGVAVSSPVRTLVDLARRVDPDGPDGAAARIAARGLVLGGMASAQDGLDWLEVHPRIPGRVAATALMVALVDVTGGSASVTPDGSGQE